MTIDVPYSNAQFNRSVDNIGQIITQGLRETEAEDFFTWAYLIYSDKFSVNVLAVSLGKSATEAYEILVAFGTQLASDHPPPVAAFVATHAIRNDRSEYIWISGATPDGRRNNAELSVTLTSPSNTIRVSAFLPAYCDDASTHLEEHTLAEGLLKGFLS
jgi:hypothetical protein